jgi:hypothetical protein
MRRTSTLHAAAAALGMLAGFAMTPADRPLLAGEVTPHAVAVAWDEHTPPELPVAGVQADDWGGRLAPAPSVKLAPMRARAPEGRAAPRAVTPPRKKAHGAPHPLVIRQRGLATFPRRVPECARHAAPAAPAAATRQS